MAVPKKRKSRSKSAMVKAGKPHVMMPSDTKCPNCGADHQSHHICTSCGYYNGRVHKLKAHSGETADTAS